MTGELSEEARKRLVSLLEIVSPSMQEKEMLVHLEKDWLSALPEGAIKFDAMGNIEFSIRKNPQYPTLALVAHTDTVCVQVTQKLGNGKFHFRSVGCSPHMLLGQNVIVIDENGNKYHGVIGYDTTSQFGQPKGLIYEDLWIDLPGMVSEDSVKIGDLAVLSPAYRIENGYITATALDDRLGLFIIGEIIRWYAKSPAPVNLTCLGTVQEEIGLRGAQSFAFTYKPDGIIVLDTDYATDLPASHEDQMGQLYLGRGPGVQRNANNSPFLRKLINSIASERKLTIQTSLGRYLFGGTDAASLQTNRNLTGCHIANLTLPCRYMHSPIETASLSDITSAIQIIRGVINSLPTNLQFINAV